ncbi:MAG: glycosyltransferase family 39 protein [Acidobacteriota bacterium]
MQSNRGSSSMHLAIVLLLSALLLFTNLHKGGLSGYDDALYAHEGEQILATGDWWNIHYNGENNYEYPPLFFWLEALSMSIWGITDFAAKFPSALLGFLTICAVYFIGRSSDRNTLYPICAAWVLMLTQYFLKYSMHVMTDVPYAFFFTLTILFYIKGIGRPLYFLLAGLAVACAILTRSVLGLIPMAVILCHIAWAGHFRLLRSFSFISGMVLAVVLPSLWYFPQYFSHGQPFLDRALEVITSKVSPGGEQSAGGSLWALLGYPGLLLKVYWPWLPFMTIGFWIELKKALRSGPSLSVLLILWVLLVVGPLSMMHTKTLRYIMPAFPVFALLAAIPLSRWLIRLKPKRFFPAIYIMLCLFVVGVAVFSTPSDRAKEVSKIGASVEARVPETERFILYTNGEVRHDYRNQFLWYARRYLDFTLEPAEFVRKLRDPRNRYFVVDLGSSEGMVLPSGVKIIEWARTGQWVFFEKD